MNPDDCALDERCLDCGRTAQTYQGSCKECWFSEEKRLDDVAELAIADAMDRGVL